MSAPKKPDYPALRKRIERMHTGVQGDTEALLALHERAVWLEEQRGTGRKQKTTVIVPLDGGKEFKGPDFKKGKQR